MILTPTQPLKLNKGEVNTCMFYIVPQVIQEALFFKATIDIFFGLNLAKSLRYALYSINHSLLTPWNNVATMFSTAGACFSLNVSRLMNSGHTNSDWYSSYRKLISSSLTSTDCCRRNSYIGHDIISGFIIEVWEWISNFFPHITMAVVAYPCWDWS